MKLYTIKYPFGETHDTVVETGQYVDGSTAIRLMSLEGEPLSVPTVCLAEYDITPGSGHVFIKEWSEGEGMTDAMIEAGLLEDVGVEYYVGPYNSLVRVCRLTLDQDVPTPAEVEL